MKDRLLLAIGALALLTGLAGLFGVGLVAARDGGTMDMMGSMMMDSRSMAGTMSNSSQPYDLRFLNSMIMHHQGAVMSSRMMIADSRRPEMRALAQAIIKSQTEQIRQMQAWRQQWYGDQADGGTSERMMGAGTGMEGMMGSSGMAGGMMGSDPDRMFLQMMIPHHQMAVDMSNDALQKAEHPEIKNLARQIIEEQTAQIKLMQGYLEAWYPG